MNTVKDVYEIIDFEKKSKKQLPKFVADFVDGGAGNESTLRVNTSDFEKIKMLPRLGNNQVQPDLSVNILGENYAMPVGIPAFGLLSLIRPGAELILARVANKYKLPFMVSSASNVALGQVAEQCEQPPWFQLYIPKSESYLAKLIKTAKDAECLALVLTVDVPVPGIRLRDRKNMLRIPYRLGFGNTFEALKKPKWLYRYLTSNPLEFPNYRDCEELKTVTEFEKIMGFQTGGELSWDIIKSVREQWQGKLVLKGVLSTKDAEIAKSLGVDMVVISNHGARQLDMVPAPITLLRNKFRNHFSKDFLMMDSGIRSGGDVLKLIASGASGGFIGKPVLHALAAHGETGVEYCMELIKEQITNSMYLMGKGNVSQVDIDDIYEG